MGKNKYILRYIPLFYYDISRIVEYIVNTLNNPAAANTLVNKIEGAIKERQPFAESFEKYESAKERRYPYYRIYVDNYVIYYVVYTEDKKDKIMEVRRVLYKGMDRTKVL